MQNRNSTLLRIVRWCAIKRFAHHTVAVMVEVMRVLFGTALGLEKFLRFPPCCKVAAVAVHESTAAFVRGCRTGIRLLRIVRWSAIKRFAHHTVAVMVEVMRVLFGTALGLEEVLRFPPCRKVATVAVHEFVTAAFVRGCRTGIRLLRIVR